MRFQRHYLDQLAYISRLKLQALFAEQHAQHSGAWLDAHRAWLRLALEMRGFVENEETFATFERARLAAEQGKSATALAETYSLIANWAGMINDSTKAEQRANDGLNVLGDRRDAEAQKQRGRLLHEIGQVHHARQEYDVALNCYEQARVLKEAHDTPANFASTLHNMGQVHHARQEYDVALNYYEQARVLEEAHGTPAKLASTLHQIGRVYQDRQEYDAAHAYLQQALSIREQDEDQEALAGALYRLAAICLDRNDCQAALGYVRRALDIRRAHNLDSTDDEALENRIVKECSSLNKS